MSADPPPPLTTTDIDLDGMPGFMLDTEQLRQSELWALSTGEEFKAAVGLWCRAWVQKPAGSLPNDDRLLAAWSGAGKRWAKVRSMALRGFLLCSDGRLYHPVLCQDAHRAWGRRASYRERASNAAAARWGGQKQSTSNASSMLKPPQGEGQGQLQGHTPAAAAAVVAPGADVFDGPGKQPQAAAMTRSWMDWKITIGRHRVYIDREGNAEDHWAALYTRAGWDEFTKAWTYCAGKTAKPDGKVFLSNMLEVIK
jgi:hypothetical protein